MDPLGCSVVIVLQREDERAGLSEGRTRNSSQIFWNLDCERFRHVPGMARNQSHWRTLPTGYPPKTRSSGNLDV